MKNSRSILCLSILCLFTACKKDPDFKPDSSGGNTNVAACQITLDQNDQNTSFGNQFTFSYDANFQVTQVVAQLSGAAFGTIDVTGTTTTRTYSGETETFDFSKNIFTGQPDSYTYSSTDPNQAGFSEKLTYDNNGKVIKAEKFDANNALQTTLDLTYNDNENLTAITITAAADGSTPLTFTATGYGTRNSPFYGQSGAQCLFYYGDYGNTDYTNLFLHLSRHNITGWSLTFTGGSETSVYNYNTFNDQDYPTSVTETITNVSTNNPQSTSDVEFTYTYDCK